MRDVVLSAEELRIAKFIGERKRERSRSAGDRDNKRAPAANVAIQIDGFAAELAFCKLFNLYPEFSIDPAPFDCERFGQSLDIKSTRYPTGRLLVLPHKAELAADVYALMVCAPPRFHFAGFARASELLRPERLRDLGYGPNYTLDQADLDAEQVPRDQINWGITR